MRTDAEIDASAEGEITLPRKVRKTERHFSAHFQVQGGPRDVFKMCSMVEVPRPISPRKMHAGFNSAKHLLQEAAAEHLGRDSIQVHLLEVVEGGCGHHYSNQWLEKSAMQMGDAHPTRVLVQSWDMVDPFGGMVSMFKSTQDYVYAGVNDMIQKAPHHMCSFMC